MSNATQDDTRRAPSKNRNRLLSREEARLDPDARSAGAGMKVAAAVDAETFTAREADRASNRELDAMIQASPGYRQSSKDAGSAFPRDATEDLAHPAMDRRMPEPDEIRAPISQRQTRARARHKADTQNRLSSTQHQAMHTVISDAQAWDTLNDKLSDRAGNMQDLPEHTRRQVRRLDTAIQTYEQTSGRAHVLYTSVQMPDYVQPHQVQDYVQARLAAGSSVTFDRYSMTTHQLHEQEHRTGPGTGPVVVFEIKTRRGMYLGSSTGSDTSHMLPRSFTSTVSTTAHRAPFRRADGSLGEAIVIQLTDPEA